MSTTFPFEHMGVEYVADVVASKSEEGRHVAYFITINGDKEFFINLIKDEGPELTEDSRSESVGEGMKAEIIKVLTSLEGYPYKL